MKLIFLDIDGVLNSSDGHKPYVSDMEVEKLKLLKRLIDETNTFGVVITSDRRYSEVDMRYKVEAFNEFGIKVVGSLRKPNINDPEDNRGKQIVDYLASSKDDIEKIVILDDNDDGISSLFEDELILVNNFYGLNKDIVDLSAKILNN